MMAPKLVSKAAQWLAAGKDRTSPPEPTSEERRQAIAALELALAERSQNSARGQWWQISVAAGLLLAVGFGVGYAVLGRSRDLLPVASVLAGSGRIEGSSSPLSSGETLPGERRIETGAAQSLELAWAGLAHVRAEADSTFALLQLGDQHLLRLERGAVSLEVAPLPATSRLLVETLDVSVEVRGTAFRVAIDPAGSSCASGMQGTTTTTVKVSHGLVAVRRRGEMVAALGAGQSWPVCPVPTAQVEPARVVAESPRGITPPKRPAAKHGRGVLVPPSGHRPEIALRETDETVAPELPTSVSTPEVAAASERRAEPAATSPTPARAASSDLGLQNDLFASALTAKADGKNAKALAALGQLLQRWPQSALAENARAERMRLLAQMGRKAAATAAAHDYLTYHPSGFAHAEATSLLAIPSP